MDKTSPQYLPFKRPTLYGSTKYEEFLRIHLHKVKWEYYSAIKAIPIDACDSEAIIIIYIPLDPDPQYAPVAVGHINGEYVCIYDEYCWIESDNAITRRQVEKLAHIEKTNRPYNYGFFYKIGTEKYL